jgi:hypothetical protein
VDLDGNGTCYIVDMHRIINSALGGSRYGLLPFHFQKVDTSGDSKKRQTRPVFDLEAPAEPAASNNGLPPFQPDELSRNLKGNGVCNDVDVQQIIDSVLGHARLSTRRNILGQGPPSDYASPLR